MPRLSLLRIALSLLIPASPAFTQDLDLLNLPVIAPESREEFLFLAPELPTEATLTPTSTEQPLSEGEDFTGDEAIQTQTLNVGIKSIGATHPNSLPIDTTLWQDADYISVFAALQGLRGRPDSALNNLLRDALLAPAVLPKSSTDQDFLWLRARTLARLGMISDALTLLAEATRLDEKNTLLRDSLLVQNYDTQALCPRSPLANASEQPLQILCLLVQNKPREAALQARLLQEFSPETAEENYLLIAQLATINATSLPLGEFLQPHPLAILMADAGGITPRFAAEADIPVTAARMLLSQPLYPIKPRLELAEAAYHQGFASPEDIRRTQLAQTFAANEYNNAEKLLTEFPTIRSRALGIQALHDTDNPKALLLAALQHADSTNQYLLMLDLIAPDLARFTPQEKSLTLARAYLGLSLLEQSRAALPKQTNDPIMWVLNNVLFPQEEFAPLQPQQDAATLSDTNALLQSLIIEDDTPTTETPLPSSEITSWQGWYSAMENTPRQRDMLLALLPTMGVQPNIGATPAPSIETLNRPKGLRLIDALHALRQPKDALDPLGVNIALSELSGLGFADIAKTHAARLLAAFLHPQG